MQHFSHFSYGKQSLAPAVSTAGFFINIIPVYFLFILPLSARSYLLQKKLAMVSSGHINRNKLKSYRNLYKLVMIE
jgi:hypothetical protein